MTNKKKKPSPVNLNEREASKQSVDSLVIICFLHNNTELQGKKRMIIQIIMTESTGYLDMNKKTCVIQVKPINSLLFCFSNRAELDRSIDRSLLTQKKPPSQIPKKHSSIHCLLLALTRKKNFHAFFKKKLFSTPTGIRTHTKKKSWFPPQRAPSARSPRARQLPAAAAAARARRRCRPRRHAL